MKMLCTCCYPSEIASAACVFTMPQKADSSQKTERTWQSGCTCGEGGRRAAREGGPLRKSVKWIIHHFESADQIGG